MTLTLKNLILISKEQENSLVGRYFSEQGLELRFVYDPLEIYLFAVDNVCPEVLNIPRLQTLDDIEPTLKKNVRCRVNADMLMSTLGKKLLDTYFNNSKDFNIVERFSAEMKKVVSFKLHEALNIGYFVDSVVIEAYKAKFEISKLREFLNKAFMYAVEKNENNSDQLPIEVSYSHDSDALAVQISFSLDGFDEKNELNFFLNNLVDNCNLLDVTYLSNRKRLVISLVNFKRGNMQNAKGYIFTEIDSKNAGELPDDVELVSGLKFNSNVTYKAVPKEIHTDRFVLANKFATFIIDYRATDESSKFASDLTVSDIEDYLSLYPKKVDNKIVDAEMKEFILNLIKSDQLFTGVNEYVSKIAQSADLSEIENEDLVTIKKGNSLINIEDTQVVKGHDNDLEKDHVTTVKGTKGEKESSTTVKGGATEEAEQVTKIQGSPGDGKEAITLVKGNADPIKESSDKYVISSDANSAAEQKWEVKKLSSSDDVEADSSDVMKVTSLDNGGADKDGKTAPVVKELTQQAFHQIKDRLELQVTKMKTIVDSMKGEITKLRSDVAEKELALAVVKQQEQIKEKTEALEDEFKAAPVDKISPEIKENVMLKNSLVKAIDAIKLKDKQLAKTKTDFEMAVLAKELKAKNLEEKIESMKLEMAHLREAGGEDKLKQLEEENRKLESRVELAKGKVSIMSDNLSTHDNALLEKKEKEVEALKNGLQTAQTFIERLKAEKIDLEVRMSVDREALSKLREDKDNPGGSPKLKQEMADKDDLIHSLTLEKRTAEDKHKLVSMELKKTEQRLKFAIAQLEASSKKRDGTGIAAQKSADAYAKQLDQANSRLSEVSLEVTEKKKELLKLKHENTLLSVKLSDLERKLASLDKKAA